MPESTGINGNLPFPFFLPTATQTETIKMLHNLLSKCSYQFQNRKGAPSIFLQLHQAPFRTKITTQNNQITLYHRFVCKENKILKRGDESKERKNFLGRRKSTTGSRVESGGYLEGKNLLSSNNRSVGDSLIVKSDAVGDVQRSSFQERREGRSLPNQSSTIRMVAAKESMTKEVPGSKN